MSINERIKSLRKELKLTQAEFGERIGLKKTAASRIEQEGEPINTRVVQLICSNFHVSEEWLLHGTGQKYVASEDMILQELTKEFTLTPDHEVLVRQLLKLPPEAVDAVVNYTLQVADALKTRRQEEQRQAELKRQEEQKRQEAAAKTAMVADSDRPAGISDDEWELIKMSRIEKTQISDSSSSGMPAEKEA
jgi:transcriptional regulator with XRE-family HTH domain